MGLTSRVGLEFATLRQMNVIWNTGKSTGNECRLAGYLRGTI